MAAGRGCSWSLCRKIRLLGGRSSSPMMALRRGFILGIESSCDDTGVGILDRNGVVRGEAIRTQTSARYGGVIPSFAMGFHAEALPEVTRDAVQKLSGEPLLDLGDLRRHGVEVVAVTNRPGLSGSLSVGVKFAQYLSMKNGLPIVPVHHMEAHATTVRLTQEVPFPFLVLLISGGHCLLALAEDIDSYKLLGRSWDNSPGEILDKVARKLKLHMLRPDLAHVSGGRAVEVVAGEGGDHTLFPFNVPMRHRRCCDFSFAGYLTSVYGRIRKMEKALEPVLEPDALLPDVNHLCAGVQYGVAKHLAERLQRGVEFLDLNRMWIEAGPVDSADESRRRLQRPIVVSGGVASNQMIRQSLEKVARHFGCWLVAPEPKYCTDNGVMIAWNGLEKFRRGKEVVRPEDAKGIQLHPRAPFGVDISARVEEANIKCAWVPIY